MGGKFSKKGSYNLSKREKKNKKTKDTGLQERACSFISLTDAQKYEDELKSPNLSPPQRPSTLFENHNVNVVTNEVATTAKASFSSKPSSDHGIYSSSSDEALYENIFGEDEPELEEQLERKISDPMDTSEGVQQGRKRKTWPKRDSEGDEQFFNMVEETANSETNGKVAEKPLYANTTDWEDVLNGDFWRGEQLKPAAMGNHPEQNKLAEEDESQLEVDHKQDEGGANEQVQTAEIRDTNQAQDQTIEGNQFNQLTEDARDQTEIWSENQEIGNVVDSVKLPEWLQHQEDSKRDSSNTLLQTVDRDDLGEQLEVTDLHTNTQTVEYKKKQPHRVTFKDLVDLQSTNENQGPELDSILEEQMEVPTENRQKTLSKSSSFNSDIYYELAYDESEADSEEQELFYDAEDSFQTEAQVEVNETETNPIADKIKPSRDLLIALDQAGKTEFTRDFENQTSVELAPKSSPGDDENVGILIDFSEDTSKVLEDNPQSYKSDLEELRRHSKTSISEQIEIVEELEGFTQAILVTDISEEQPRAAEASITNQEPEQPVEKEVITAAEVYTNNDDPIPGNEQSPKHSKEQSIQNSQALEEADFTNGVSTNTEDYVDQPMLLLNIGGDVTEPTTKLEVENPLISLEGENGTFTDSENDPEPSVPLIDLQEDSHDKEPSEVIEKIHIHPPVEKADEKNHSDHAVQLIDLGEESMDEASNETWEHERITQSSNPATLTLSIAELPSEPKTEFTTPEEIESLENVREKPESITQTPNPSSLSLSTTEETSESKNEVPCTITTPEEIESLENVNKRPESIIQPFNPSTLSISIAENPSESKNEVPYTIKTPEEIQSLENVSKGPERVTQSSNTPTLTLSITEEPCIITTPEEIELLKNVSKVPDSIAQFSNPSTLTLCTAEKTSESKNEFKVPSTITTPEEIAEEQMRQWEKDSEEQIEAVISEINMIILAVKDLKVEIANLGSTDRDQETHGDMYQTVIKIMREVNGINNYNFNERILNLQHLALNEVHGCLRDLQLKST